MDVFEEIANRKDSNQFNHFIYWKDYTLTHFYPTKKNEAKMQFSTKLIDLPHDIHLWSKSDCQD